MMMYDLNRCISSDVKLNRKQLNKCKYAKYYRYLGYNLIAPNGTLIFKIDSNPLSKNEN